MASELVMPKPPAPNLISDPYIRNPLRTLDRLPGGGWQKLDWEPERFSYYPGIKDPFGGYEATVINIPPTSPDAIYHCGLVYVLSGLQPKKKYNFSFHIMLRAAGFGDVMKYAITNGKDFTGAISRERKLSLPELDIWHRVNEPWTYPANGDGLAWLYLFYNDLGPITWNTSAMLYDINFSKV